MFSRMNRMSGVLAATLLTFLATACSKPAPPVAEKPLDLALAARINGEAIYLSDIELEAAAQGLISPGTPFGSDDPAFAKVLDQLIDQKLLAQEARARKLELDPAGARRLDIARERILANLLMEDIVAREVTEETIQKMYAEQVELLQINDEVSVAHILVETETQIRDVARRLKRGESFESLVLSHSTDTASRMEQGNLGWLTPNDEPQPFPTVIARTATGAVSEPFKSDLGWHVLKVKDRRDKAPKSFDEMRPEIASFLTLNEVNKLLRRLRTSAVVQDAGQVEAAPKRAQEEQAPVENLPPAANPGDEL